MVMVVVVMMMVVVVMMIIIYNDDGPATAAEVAQWPAHLPAGPADVCSVIIRLTCTIRWTHLKIWKQHILHEIKAVASKGQKGGGGGLTVIRSIHGISIWRRALKN